MPSDAVRELIDVLAAVREGRAQALEEAAAKIDPHPGQYSSVAEDAWRKWCRKELIALAKKEREGA